MHNVIFPAVLKKTKQRLQNIKRCQTVPIATCIQIQNVSTKSKTHNKLNRAVQSQMKCYN